MAKRLLDVLSLNGCYYLLEAAEVVGDSTKGYYVAVLRVVLFICS